MSIDIVMRYSKHIDRALNAKAGMRTNERGANADLWGFRLSVNVYNLYNDV